MRSDHSIRNYHPIVSSYSEPFFLPPPGRWFQVWGKTEEKIYGPVAGTDYRDNQLRFSLLCQVRMACYYNFRSSVCSSIHR
jgi:hypothetical protein